MASIWKCPCCNSSNLDYENIQLENESACFPRTCQNCGAEGLERYILEYDDQEVITAGNLHTNENTNVYTTTNIGCETN